MCIFNSTVPCLSPQDSAFYCCSTVRSHHTIALACNQTAFQPLHDFPLIYNSFVFNRMLLLLMWKFHFKSYQPSLHNLISNNKSLKLCHVTIWWSLLGFTRKMFVNLSSSSFVQNFPDCKACYDVSLSLHQINSVLLSRNIPFQL